MVVHTIDGMYSVECTVRGSKKLLTYLCVRAGSTGAEKFLVMGAKERELSKTLLCGIEGAEQAGTHFAEEVFVKDGAVWMVFPYYTGMSWNKKVKSDMTFEERRKAGQELIAQIFAEKLPGYLQYEAAAASNIVADKSRGICVNFLLREPERSAEPLFKAAQRRAADRMDELFLQKRDKAAAEAERFVNRLRNAEFEGEAELYAAYRRMDEAMERIYAGHAKGEEAEQENGDRWSGVRDRVLKYAGAVFRFLYWALIGGLMGLLVYVCIRPDRAPEERLRFERIGTLEFAEDMETD